jgi:hypothetical protein
VHDHAGRADRAEQREAGRDDPPEPFVVEPTRNSNTTGAVELALALRARGEAEREFLDAQRRVDGGEECRAGS